MATTRSSQSRKRVQQIVDDAAEQIAAVSDVEEEVVVVVEELPPGESARRRRAATTAAPEAAVLEAPISMMAQAQVLAAATIDRWTEAMSAFAGTRSTSVVPFGRSFDARQITEDSFRLAEAVLATQKDLTLRLVDMLGRARAA